MSSKIIIDEITRIEGHLNVTIEIKDNLVRARAESMEGIRLLEDILLGKYYWDVPDITSRMCGVCQAIHRITSIQAIEKALNIELSDEIKLIRELIAIAGHIQSHIIHLHLFVLPDIYYKRSIIDLIPSHRELIMKAIKIKGVMDEIVKLYGGRTVHPITPVIGGFTAIPKNQYAKYYLEKLNELKENVINIIEPILNISWPDFNRKTTYLSLKGKKIPLLDGIIFDGDIEFLPEEFDKYIEPEIENYSTARHYLFRGVEYFVGALSRINNNSNELSDNAKELMEKYGYKFPSYNTFHNNVAQALEIIHYYDRALDIFKELSKIRIKKALVDYEINEGYGVSATEAPRGLLIHAYRIDDDGKIIMARIITPTAQNYKNMERDIEKFVSYMLDRGIIKREVETLIRAYDPCVSCSARFIPSKLL